MKKLLILSVFACLMSTAFAFADDNPMGKGDHGMMMDHKKAMKMQDKMDLEEKFYGKIMIIMLNSKEINLTDDQMTKIHAIKMKVKRNLILKEAEIEAAALDIMEALNMPEPDMAAINALIDKKYDLKKQNAKDLVSGIMDIRGILTAEQRTMVKDIWMNQMIGHMKMMMGEEGCPLMKKPTEVKPFTDVGMDIKK